MTQDTPWTPGPWYAADWPVDGGPHTFTVEVRLKEVLAVGQAGIWPGGIQSHLIAEIHEGVNPLADARLIASAPALYEALEVADKAIVALYTAVSRGDADAGERFALNDPAVVKARDALLRLVAMTDTMIELVARAIWQAHEDRNPIAFTRQTWEQGSETAKAYRLADACAAIGAMEEYHE